MGLHDIGMVHLGFQRFKLHKCLVKDTIAAYGRQYARGTSCVVRVA